MKQSKLSVLLGIAESDVRASLCAQGVLSPSGLLSINRSGMVALIGKLDLLSDRFADLMLSPNADPVICYAIPFRATKRSYVFV